MKILFNVDYKALRAGEYVSAGEGEFIIDTDCLSRHEQFTKSTYVEIAKTHGFEIPNKTKVKDFYDQLIEKIILLELPQMNEQPLTDLLTEIVKNGFDEEKSDDDIMGEFYATGRVKITEIQKTFKQICEKAGLRIAVKDAKEMVGKVLDEIRFNESEKTYDEVEAIVSHFVYGSDDINAIKGITEARALSYVRSWAKLKEFELPKKPKGAGGKGSTLQSKMLDFLFEGGYVRDNLDDLKAIESVIADKVKEFKDNITAEQLPKYVVHSMVSVNFAAKCLRQQIAQEQQAAQAAQAEQMEQE